MKLDDRKIRILSVIVKSYLDTGEPVGSRTISRISDISLSPATIRNEMSDLETLGYIYQPYTSSGRVPTDKGYRFYVDNLLKEKTKEISDIKLSLQNSNQKIEDLLETVANVLAEQTQYTTLVSKPKYQNNKIKFLQLSKIDEESLLFIIVFDKNRIKNFTIDDKYILAEEDVLKINLTLNTYLSSLSITDINLKVINSLKTTLKGYEYYLDKFFYCIETTLEEEENVEIITSGTPNILRYKELADSTMPILNTLEEKKMLETLISEFDKENGKVQILIGDENEISALKDCSVITFSYRIADDVYGKIGIVGPKRMDYENVVSTIYKLMNGFSTGTLFITGE